MSKPTRDSELGASAVEFSVVVSVLILFLMGTIQFGAAYHRYQGLQASAREAARLASLPQSRVADIRERARQAMSAIDPSEKNEDCPTPDAGEYCVVITPGSSDDFRPCFNRSGQTVEIEVRHRMEISMPLWESPGLTLSGHGVFRCE